MNPIFRLFFDAIPQAATSKKAVLAYVIASVITGLLLRRIQRNKLLLDNIEKIPTEDRLDVLRMEMDAVPVREGLSAEQLLRSRAHRYYFWGFVTVCILAAVIFGIAAYVALTTPAKSSPVAIAPPTTLQQPPPPGPSVNVGTINNSGKGSQVIIRQQNNSTPKSKHK